MDTKLGRIKDECRFDRHGYIDCNECRLGAGMYCLITDQEYEEYMEYMRWRNGSK